MNLIDTHSHIYQEDFDEDRTDVIARAAHAGIRQILLPNIDVESIPKMNRLSAEYPDSCFPMMGLHPTSVGEDYQKQLDIIHSWFSKQPYIAVGEIGLDLYWDKTHLREQIEAFETQLQWSIELDLPVVIHNRDAFIHVMNSIRKTGANRLRGIFHSFGGTKEELDEILALPHFLVGINGVVTFKNSGLSEVLKDCPIEKIVLETDAPYLSPVPFRGKRNEPVYMLHTAEKLAAIFSTGVEEIARQTTGNVKRLFRLPASTEL